MSVCGLNPTRGHVRLVVRMWMHAAATRLTHTVKLARAGVIVIKVLYVSAKHFMGFGLAYLRFLDRFSPVSAEFWVFRRTCVTPHLSTHA